MKYLTEEQANEYRKLEELAAQANKALDELVLATLQADLTMEVKVKIVGWIEGRTSTFRGLPYFLHPQSEWMGGDSFNTREPHIVG